MSFLKENSDNNCVGIQHPTLNLLLEQASLELLERYIYLDLKTGSDKDDSKMRIQVLEKFIQELVEESMASNESLQIKIPNQPYIRNLNGEYMDGNSPSNSWEAARAELDPDEIKYLAGKMFDLEKASDELLSNN